MDPNGGATASGAPKPDEPKSAEQYKSYVQQGIDEQRYMVPTKGGVIDEIMVQKFKEAHMAAVKDNDGAAKATEDDKQPTVNAITSN